MKQPLGNDIVLVEGLNELNVQLTPVPIANLSGIVTDNLDGSKIAGAIVTLGGLTTYTDINGIYSFYGLAPGTYNGLIEKEHYHSLGFTANLVSGDNFLDLAIDPILLASVVIGIRTRASQPGLDSPHGGYLSRPTLNGGLVGTDYIPNTSYYTDYTVILPTNPSTEQAWRETDLEKCQFGVWLWASVTTPAEYPDTRCTQLWVVANYPDGSSRVLRPYQGPGWEKVADVVPDEDASYISYTTSGGMIPWSGGFFNYKVR